MTAAVSWYGPLIDLSAAASHLGGFVQLVAAARRVLPYQEQNAATGRIFQKTIVEVGDDTRSSFSVSLWSSKHSSTITAGDVLLLQNIKIVEFRNGLEGRASQISAVQVLLNSKDVIQPEYKVAARLRLSEFRELLIAEISVFPISVVQCMGCSPFTRTFPVGKERDIEISVTVYNFALASISGIGELIFNCKVGDATKSKLRKVAEWILHTKCTLGENRPQLQVGMQNWKEGKEKASTAILSTSELLLQSELCNGNLSVIEKLSLVEHNDIVRDFVTTGCKLCSLPLHLKNFRGESTFPVDCPNNPKYLHMLGQIYNPFMIYVQDQSGQIPLLVRNKAAEILFANITAEDVSECYKNHHCMLLESSESGNLGTPGMLAGTANKGITKRKRTKEKPDFHLIWLIMIKCLLKQGKNSPFCFQISVNPEKNVEDGRFELISFTMPIT
ncbi:hypothetical protein ACP4OV_024295 [Aristida adscensionis]